ncbi:threonine-phosphate decarboxylase [bacterium BMS3Bbin06]|nr:threonine-phosphate decarboxylase [bacterium BMS3Abin08]GBE34614.1 threonine-phosphate decarboxylase [bacterium BMS3Bbin06]HDH01061.1 aminotransferase class I/II-fold pyridoxal phosphate-dependent enzyme [Nitrospirota bacterium]HDO35810.1 aminotransferase class I/II-fold pyridoxal phosphate-dependent enzyme [Nitrospirota bacterium]HDY72071.1 aminotransferase class I/II-fold pyridoxal phosphate-dependent enzyme [Nitrospirota bacterium]
MSFGKVTTHDISEQAGIPTRKILDFTSPANPLGISKKVKTELRKHLKYLSSPPDPQCRNLRHHLGRHHGIDPSNIICTPSFTAPLIKLGLQMHFEGVLVPASHSRLFKETSIACSIRKCTKYEYKKNLNGKYSLNLDKVLAGLKPRQLVLVPNPDIITGQLYPEKQLVEILKAAEEKGCVVVMDESFIDYADKDVSLYKFESSSLIVFRSMSAFYPLPGLLLGYCIYPPALAEVFKEPEELMLVNSLAQRAGIIALKDRAFRDRTFSFIKTEKAFLEKCFRRLGVRFFPSSTNTYLLEHEKAQEIIKILTGKGVLLDSLKDIAGLDEQSFGLSIKTHRENAVLVREIKKLIV